MQPRLTVLQRGSQHETVLLPSALVQGLGVDVVHLYNPKGGHGNGCQGGRSVFLGESGRCTRCSSCPSWQTWARKLCLSWRANFSAVPQSKWVGEPDYLTLVRLISSTVTTLERGIGVSKSSPSQKREILRSPQWRLICMFIKLEVGRRKGESKNTNTSTKYYKCKYATG